MGRCLAVALLAAVLTIGVVHGAKCPAGCDSNACNRDGTCSYCEGNFTPNKNGTACLKCPYQCDGCYYDLRCSGCQEGFVLTPKGACIECVADGCLECYPDGRCAECDTGYYPTNDARCKPCPDKLCWFCGKGGKCNECYSDTDQAQLSIPNTSIYKDKAGICRACTAFPFSTGCLKCSGDGKACVQCDSAYRLGNGRCHKCGTNCEQCDVGAKKCLQCVPGYGPNKKGLCVPCPTEHCDQCAPGTLECTKCMPDWEANYYLDQNKQCQPCNIYGCDTCAPDGHCQKCFDFYKLINGTCVEKNASDDCADMNCKACPRGRNVCGLCMDSYYLTAKGTCAPCSLGCEKCTGPGRCTACTFLSLVQGFCVRCMDPRCADCSGDRNVCRRCRYPGYVVDPGSKRCVKRDTTVAAAAGTVSDNSVDPAIVGGVNATRGRYPYYASLRVNSPHDLYPHNCGGSLITPWVVLTAAHCVTTSAGDWAREEVALPQVRLRAYDAFPGGSRGGKLYETRYAIWTYVSPRFNPSTEDTDFALILLHKPSRFTPIKLTGSQPSPSVPDGAVLRLIGLGSETADGPDPYVLQQLERVKIPRHVCRDTMRQFEMAVTAHMMCCQGRRQAATSACYGDSGGPLFVPGRNAFDDRQVGIVSWGHRCGMEGNGTTSPDVYTDIQTVRGDIAAGLQFIATEARRLLGDRYTG